MTPAVDTLIVVRSEADSLIRDEVRSARQRARLEHAVRDAVLKLGVSVDEASNASGLTPDEIRRVLAEVPATDGLAVLTGVG